MAEPHLTYIDSVSQAPLPADRITSSGQYILFSNGPEDQAWQNAIDYASQGTDSPLVVFFAGYRSDDLDFKYNIALKKAFTEAGCAFLRFTYGGYENNHTG